MKFGAKPRLSFNKDTATTSKHFPSSISIKKQEILKNNIFKTVKPEDIDIKFCEEQIIVCCLGECK